MQQLLVSLGNKITVITVPEQFCHFIIELNRNPNISNCVSLHKYQHLSKEPKRDVKNDKPHSNYFASIFLLHAVHAHNKSIGNATDLVGKVYDVLIQNGTETN